jgi:ATP-dependent protease HslVU (ClpYQ) peptidase subunit
MTVIAWDGTTLAADKRAEIHGSHMTVRKIFRLRDGSLVGCAGDSTWAASVVAWLNGARDPQAYPLPPEGGGTVIVVGADGAARLYQRSAFPLEVEDATVAVGSGRDYARTAMALGFDAVRAVEVACALDCYCGNGIDTLTFDAAP